MLNAIKRAFANFIKKPVAPIAHNMPRSKKHIRTTHGFDYAKITYYNHAGKKVTSRRIDYKDIVRIKNNARKLGYQAI